MGDGPVFLRDGAYMVGWDPGDRANVSALVVLRVNGDRTVTLVDEVTGLTAEQAEKRLRIAEVNGAIMRGEIRLPRWRP